MKLLKTLILTGFLTVSALANATLVELTQDQFITVDHNGTDLDWAWASNYNVEFYYEFYSLTNVLYAPTIAAGWREATTAEFDYFTAEVDSDDFFDVSTGGYKNAISVFNSNANIGYSIGDLDRGAISGKFRQGTEMETSDVFGYSDLDVYDTFYVRNSLPVVPPGPTPIPEPWSILIFATGLLALQSKLRNK